MITLHHGDCIDVMKTFPDHSFDAIIADLPYGTTACKWDSVIPFEPLWKQYKRLAKKRAAIVLFGSQPFTSALVMSNVEWFKWEDIWYQSTATGHLNCNVMPLRQHQNVLVFGKGRVTYNPQLQPKPEDKIRPFAPSAPSDCYGSYKSEHKRTIPLNMSYPRSVMEFSCPRHSGHSRHPTQKPVALLEYLIRTYTNEGDTVLDNTMGSGTTMVACVNTGRNGVGIELYPLPGQPIHKTDNPDYFGIAQGRVEKAQSELIQLALI